MAEFYCYADSKSGIRFAKELQCDSANLFHFGGWHTADDWGMYWTDFSITAPEVEIYTVNVPGRHGVLDLSEVLAGHPVYKNRTLTATFVAKTPMTDWHTLYSNLVTALHGQTMQIALDTDPVHYWVGRCSVSSEMADAVHCVVTITADVQPFQIGYKMYGFLWDFTNFGENFLPEPIVISQTNSSVELNGLKMSSNVDIYVEKDTIVQWEQDGIFGGGASLKAGKNEAVCKLSANRNRFTFITLYESGFQAAFVCKSGVL